MIDVDSVTFTVAAFGSVTLGMLVFYAMSIVKGWFPTIEGRRAEMAVVGVSLLAVVLVLWAGETNWRDDGTYLALIVGTLATTMVARGVYAQLFKSSIPPEAGDRVVTVETVPEDEPQPEFGWNPKRGADV